MSSTQNPKQVVRRFLKVMATGKPGQLAALTGPGFHGSEGIETASGAESIEAYAQTYRAQIEKWGFEIERIIAEGPWVSVMGRATGKVRDQLFGIQARGKPISMPFQAFYKVARGKVVEAHVVADVSSLTASLTGEKAARRIPSQPPAQ